MPDSGGSKTKTVQTTQNSAPWAPTIPGLQQGIDDWTSLYKSGGLEVPYYPGQTVAGVAPERSDAWQMVSDLTKNPNSSSVGAATDYNNAILKGDYHALSPMFDAAKDAAGSSYEAAGRYGSGYHDNAVSKGVGSVIANAAGQAVAAAPGLQAASYLPAQMLDTVGQERQGQAQNEIQAAIDKFNYTQTQKAQAIQNFMAGLPGGSGASVTGTQPIQVQQSNPWLQGAGLAASALGSYFGS
jgi:hypothetical protein